MGFLAFIRALIFRLWPILLIILILWVIYWAFIKKKKDKDAMPPWQTKLWSYIFVTTIVLLLLSVVFLVSEFEDNSDKQYVPAHMENNKLIPGKMMSDGKN